MIYCFHVLYVAVMYRLFLLKLNQQHVVNSYVQYV